VERIYKTPGGSIVIIYGATMTLHEAIQRAQAADDAYQAAVEAAGYESRWDVPYPYKHTNAALQAAYQAKRAADDAMHDAFERSREQARTGG
jgi:hypothetical protein